jgi:hypothetical protein
LLFAVTTIFLFFWIRIAITLIVVLFCWFLSVGYNRDDGTTIPDSWAETHVLTPTEVAAIFKFRKELEEPAEQNSASNEQGTAV